MDLLTLVTRLLSNGSVARIATNPLAQFGGPARRYLGAELLPERQVPENSYREDAIRYRTVIANDGTRYSPAQRKADNQLVGSFLVELGNQDIARELTGRDYDALIRLLNTRSDMEATATLIRWLDLTVNRALIELNEKQRWDAFITAQVTRVGDNGYSEVVSYPNPAGHRVTAAGTWSNNAYDFYPDIIAMAQLLWGKGYQIGRIVTSRKVTGIMAKNTTMANKTTGRLFVNATGGVVTQPTGRSNLAAINELLSADGLPPIETYDLLYYDQSGAKRFMREDAMTFFATTGREETISEINVANGTLEVIPETLGYTAIGRAVGEAGPGRVIRMWPKDDKPPRIDAEGWSTSFPVITEPEAIAAITGIA